MPIQQLVTGARPREVSHKDALTARQQAFVHEFLISLNATEAAIKAGYSRKSAHVTASRLMKSANVKDAIVKSKEEVAARTAVTVDMVIEQLRRIAFADIRKAFRPDGTLKTIPELDEDTAAAVASVELLESANANQRTAEIRKIRILDQLSALYRLGLYLGVFDSRHKIPSGKQPLPPSRSQDRVNQIEAELAEIFGEPTRDP